MGFITAAVQQLGPFIAHCRHWRYFLELVLSATSGQSF